MTVSLYEEVLRAAGRELALPRPPRPSAGVVPWREGSRGLEVFWIQRARTMPFMGGWHAFPGGVWDRRDQEIPIAGEPIHPNPARPTQATSDPAEQPDGEDLLPGLAATALRELFEETGLLVLDRPGQRPDPRVSLASWLRESGRALDASRLVFAGRWLTPPFAPARFDNRFFLLRWQPADGEPIADPAECASGEWVPPKDALDALRSGGALAAPPIYHLLRVLAEEGPERGLGRFLDTREANLGPLRRIELRPGILLFPLRSATLPPATHTNTYLIGSRECLLVDPGSEDPGELERLEAALTVAERDLGRRAVAILLTHHHPDHVAGAQRLREKLEIPIWTHRETARLLGGRGIPCDRALQGGELLKLEGDTEPTRIRCHWTPGHAPGHLALELEGTGDLLIGDLMSPLSTVVIAPPDGDMTLYFESLERMRELSLRTLFPAHGAPLLEPQAAFAAILEHRKMRETRILEGWRAGIRDHSELVSRVYEELPAHLEPLARRQVEAHLSRLASLGRLD